MENRFVPFKHLLLEIAGCRSVDELLGRVVAALAEIPYVALARVWLRAPGDICSHCPMAAECPDRSECLHLVASAGTPATPGADWSRLDGHFRRFPVGVRKVGHVAATGEAVEVHEIDETTRWIADPVWVASECIVGLGAQPLEHQGENLGVLAVFTRVAIEPEVMDWIRMIADHAAAAIAHGRAFEEIERLRYRVQMENAYLREEVEAADEFGEIVGASPALRKVLSQIDLVAATDATVLVQGESGTGKELVARAIHRRSPRGGGPLVRVNCAAVPRELFESEFFGHAQGAFTGAVKDRVGRFETAAGGTLFLDEVGEIPMELQSKLLRVLQEGTFERVGETRTRSTDARLVAATNRDLKADVDAGRFRADLYFRLGVFPIDVPPLRERIEDVPLLAEHFLEQACRRIGTSGCSLKRRHVLDLQGYDWPGNVRELQNVIERGVILSRHGPLRFELPAARGRGVGDRSRAGPARRHEGGVLTFDELRDRERANVLAALEQTGFKISGGGGAAELLGVKPTTLTSRMKAMGIERPR